MRMPPALLLMLFATLAVARATPILSITDLGTLGGSTMAGASVNAFGQVVGYGTDVFGARRAFAGAESLSDLTPAGAHEATAQGINSRGVIAGNTISDGRTQATVWMDGTARILGGLGGSDSWAMAINETNQVAGMAVTTGGVGRAVIYRDGVADAIFTPGALWSSAYAINASGGVAGAVMNSQSRFQAFAWTPTSGYAGLGTLGGMNSYAFAINDSGLVAGHSNIASGKDHAFLWDGRNMRDLGTLGGDSSHAYGINSSGAVVGYSEAAGGSTHAFLYLNGVMFDLNRLVTDLGGWELTEAYGINDRGQIVGRGNLDGVERAFRLDPAIQLTTLGVAAVPEPGTIWLLAGGIAAIAAARRYRVRK